MIIDGHVHVDSLRNSGNQAEPKKLMNALNQCGLAGAVILSQHPTLHEMNGVCTSAADRLNNLTSWTQDQETLYPFFFINPLDEDAPEQVKNALKAGVDGFKVICNTHYPGDSRAMKIYQLIADAHKPILFHSGILWDGRVSAHFNRPAEFECLLDIKGLRFILAHVSWPWVDECIAVYGKFANTHAHRADFDVEMFIDITPGTPAIYREEVLTKLMRVDYDLSDHVIFGTDSHAYDYNTRWTSEWIDRDTEIYKRLGISKDIQDRLFGLNLLRCLGKSPQSVKRTIPYSGE